MLLSKLRVQYQKSVEARERLVPTLKIEEQEFLDELRAHGCILLAKRGVDKPFEYDSEVLRIARQLFYFTTRDEEKFEGDIRKGIALVGYYGCGKTLLMESWSELIKLRITEFNLSTPMYEFFTVQSVFNTVLSNGTAELSKRPIIIDEVGREAKSAKSWGNESLPINDLLMDRYRNGALTHITANFKLKDLSDESMYGQMLGDRLKEMFNFIEMRGGSKR